PGAGEPQGIAVGRRLGDHLRADRAVRARTVIDDDRLIELLRQSFRQNPGDEIHRTTRWKGDHDFHRTALRAHRSGEQDEAGDARDEESKPLVHGSSARHCRVECGACFDKPVLSDVEGLSTNGALYRGYPVQPRWLRKSRVRSVVGASKICAGGPCSTMRPASNTATQSPTRRAKVISCVTTTMVMPSSASAFITESTSPIVS